MSAIDKCHDQVKRAIEKDGWQITNDPFTLLIPGKHLYVDLEAKRGTNGTREQIIVVEVKCFSDPNRTTHDLYVAIGQYLIYRESLWFTKLPHSAFLAVPDNIFETVFDKIIMGLVTKTEMQIIVVNLVEERIVRWIT